MKNLIVLFLLFFVCTTSVLGQETKVNKNNLTYVLSYNFENRFEFGKNYTSQYIKGGLFKTLGRVKLFLTEEFNLTELYKDNNYDPPSETQLGFWYTINKNFSIGSKGLLDYYNNYHGLNNHHYKGKFCTSVVLTGKINL